jgi:hypothetical protein
LIVNVLSVVLLFVDAVCLGLAAFLVGWTVRQLRASRDLREADALEGFERGATLGLLTALTLVGLRILTWPLLYATLASFVPSIEGAMCIYGVTRGLPAVAKGVQAAQPVIVLLAGAWFLLDRLDRRTRTSPLARPNLGLLLALSVVLLVAIPFEILLLVGTRPTFVVTCCTTVADVASRPTALIPTRLLGEGYEGVLIAVLLAVVVILIALAKVCAFTRVLARRGPAASWLVGATALLSVLAVPVAYLAALETIAPIWTELPYHHCAYCFLVFRDAPVAIAAFLLGTFLLLWGALAHSVGGHPELREHAAAAARRCHLWGSVLLAGALGMAAIHLWMAP